MESLVLTPSDFVGLLNQTLEMAYPFVAIEGELSSFRISKNRWVYFDLKDEYASVSFFGSIYQLPGPLQDGLSVRVTGSPRLHPRFGFSVNFQSIQPVGQGAIKKAADLLAAKLEAEGLFAPERKRPLPGYPTHIGLITADGSAAYADFMKIIGSRWGGLDIFLVDVLVQGDRAPAQLIRAIDIFNQSAHPPEVLVITRGGGSSEDLAAFNDERVVRAVAASRIPVLVAVGHEVDVSLAELAADQRASTPTNAAGLVVPDRDNEAAQLSHQSRYLRDQLSQLHRDSVRSLKDKQETLLAQLGIIIEQRRHTLANLKNLSRLLDPRAALARGYAIVNLGGKHINSVKNLKMGASLSIELSDGRINSTVNKVSAN